MLHLMRVTNFLHLAAIAHSLHLISPDFTSIPYLIPRFFQNACDPSDAFFTEVVTAQTNDDTPGPISFASPPPNVTSANLKRTPGFWTHEPFCLESVSAQTGFCVYTNTRFAQGRGISIIATPNDIQYVLQAKVFVEGTHNTAAVYAPGAEKYTREAVAGERRAEVIANGTFKRGELLHSYTPIIVTEDPWIQQARQSDCRLLLSVAVERLPRASQELFLSQFADRRKDPYIDRMNKNAFSAFFGKSSNLFSAAWPETATFNHNCRPSTIYHINPETLRHESYVVKPIKPGEEITVSYLPPYLNTTERQYYLRESWGFKCTCRLCSAHPAVQAKSDERLQRIQDIIAELNVLPPNRKVQTEKAEELVRLHEEEDIFGGIADAHMFAAMEYEFAGNRRMAKKWALIAKDSVRMLHGEGEEYVAMMRIVEGTPIASSLTADTT